MGPHPLAARFAVGFGSVVAPTLARGILLRVSDGVFLAEVPLPVDDHLVDSVDGPGRWAPRQQGQVHEVLVGFGSGQSVPKPSQG